MACEENGENGDPANRCCSGANSNVHCRVDTSSNLVNIDANEWVGKFRGSFAPISLMSKGSYNIFAVKTGE
jgi:hypothetical protein